MWLVAIVLDKRTLDYNTCITVINRATSYFPIIKILVVGEEESMNQYYSYILMTAVFIHTILPIPWFLSFFTPL